MDAVSLGWRTEALFLLEQSPGSLWALLRKKKEATERIRKKLMEKVPKIREAATWALRKFWIRGEAELRFPWEFIPLLPAFLQSLRLLPEGPGTVPFLHLRQLLLPSSFHLL